MKLDMPQAAATMGAVTYESLYDRLAPTTRIILDNLKNYADVMGPKKPMVEAIGIRHQTKFYNTLIQLVTLPTQEDFRPAMAAALLIIEEHRNAAFSELNVMRFGELKGFLDKDKRNAFRTVVHFFITIAPRDTRTLMLRQVDIFKCFRHCVKIRAVKEEHIQRLNDFVAPFRA